MFGIRNLTPSRLITYGLIAFASQKLARRSYQSLNQSRQTKAKNYARNRKIDTASRDSFPASDPPSHMAGFVGPSQ